MRLGGELMKKDGLLNQELMSALTGLGHGDTFMICGADFSIPKGADRIDLALTAGIPDVMQVLKAVLDEVVVEEVAYCEEMEEISPELFARYSSLFSAQIRLTPQWAKFALMAQQARFFIRTGDLTPYASIILTSASGVRAYNEKFDIQL